MMTLYRLYCAQWIPKSDPKINGGFGLPTRHTHHSSGNPMHSGNPLRQWFCQDPSTKHSPRRTRLVSAVPPKIAVFESLNQRKKNFHGGSLGFPLEICEAVGVPRPRRCGPASPTMVCVFPVEVCPYAMMAPLRPNKMPSTASRPALWKQSWKPETPGGEIWWFYGISWLSIGDLVWLNGI